MKHFAIILTLVLLWGIFPSTYIHAQGHARGAFLESPDYVIPSLNTNTKKDLIDIYEAAQKEGKAPQSVTNLFGGSSVVTSLSDTAIAIQLDDATSVQIKLLPMINNSFLICMVSTSLVTPKQSVVRFFGQDWKDIDGTGLFSLPPTEAFLVSPDDIHQTRVKTLLAERGVLTHEVICDPHNPEIRVRLTIFDDSVAQVSFAELSKLFKEDGITMRWDGAKFVPVK